MYFPFQTELSFYFQQRTSQSEFLPETLPDYKKEKSMKNWLALIFFTVYKIKLIISYNQQIEIKQEVLLRKARNKLRMSSSNF